MKKERAVNIKHTRYGEQKQIYKKIVKDKVCPFCHINYHPRPIIKSGKFWIATENGWPYEGTKVHVIFILKKHKTHIKNLTNSEWSELLNLFKTITKKYHLDGGAVFLRFGDTNKTGASVNHLHAQILMGKKGGNKKNPLLVQLGYK